MSTLQEMISLTGSIENAEKVAISLGPDFYLDLQLCLAAQGKWVEAAKINKKRPRNNGRDMFASGLYSVIDGDLPTGIFEMHCGRMDGLFGSKFHLNGKLLTPDVTNRVGKTVILSGEGGLGDQIINVRFAKVLADQGMKVIVSCDQSLISVFERVDGVSKAITSEQSFYEHHDYWLPAMSAPGMLGIGFPNLSGKPFLSARPESVDKFKAIMGNKQRKRIGIKWMGNPNFEHEQYRKFPKELLFDAVRDHDVWSLDISEPCPDEFNDAAKFIKSWEDTLGALSNLDLLITSCTSLAHASAALGIETWVVVPVMPYYVWAHPIDGDKSPWYDCARLFRQKKFGKWGEPFDQIKQALSQTTQLENV